MESERADGTRQSWHTESTFVDVGSGVCLVIIGEVEVVVVRQCRVQRKRAVLVDTRVLVVTRLDDGLQAWGGWRWREPGLLEHAHKFVAHCGRKTAASGNTMVPERRENAF